MKSFVAMFALTALVNAVPDPQVLLNYPVTYSGLYNQQLVNPYYRPLTRYTNGAAVPVEPIANQKAKLEHFKAKAEEYEKKGFNPYVAVHSIYKRDAEPEPQVLLNYPVTYSGLYNQHLVNPYKPLTRYINGAVVPVEPIANQKAKLEHFKAKAEEYEKKGFNPYVAVHSIYKRDAEPEPEPFLPYAVNPMIYRQPALINSPYVYRQPGLINPAVINPVVTYRQEIDDESTPADTQRVTYTQKVLASPFYSALTYPVIRQEERKSVEKRDADSQFLTYPRPYSSIYNPTVYNSAVYPNALYSGYNAFNPLNVARPIIAY